VQVLITWPGHPGIVLLQVQMRLIESPIQFPGVTVTGAPMSLDDIAATQAGDLPQSLKKRRRYDSSLG
jgi:hypothetical protein